ncbi:MAG: PAS domain S-box protein [Acidobacteria bacterium]|nr:PAS domain S-box protein [Acidobacteriota bacterium]
MHLSPELLLAIFDHAAHFMGLLDLQGHLLATNRPALELVGASPAEVEGKPFWETPWWTHDPAAAEALRGAVRQASQGKVVRLETTHPARDGSLRIVDFTLSPLQGPGGTIQWLLPEGRDITERRAATLALRESEAKFRLLFQRNHDGILLLDGDRFTECNQAVLSMMRCTEPELLRMHPWDLSPPTQPDGRPSPEKALEMIGLAHEKGGHRFEWVHRRTDGEDFPVEVTLTPIPLGGREVLYTTWRDITERKHEEQERLGLERRILHAQKLESLGVLAGGIAHDFNNLLSAMIGHLELAGLTLPPGGKATVHLQAVEGLLNRAAELTRQMLAYSGRGTRVTSPLDLSALVEDLTGLLRVSISKKINLDLDLAPRLPAISADLSQINQVLLNLVTNASDAIGDAEGEIHIATGIKAMTEAEIRGLRTDGPMTPGLHVFLEVSDTGSGMNEQVMARLFEPFFSTKSQGRGLGLSAILGILRSHSGGLHLESRPGEGSTFRLFFPALEVPAPDRPTLEAPRPLPPKLRVLLADDEPALREAVAEALDQMGHSVLQARDGVEALEKAREEGESLSMVVLDMTMPRMDGREALAALRGWNPHLPVVLCSGYTDLEDLATLLASGPATFLPKPYTIRELADAMARALAGT